MAALPLLPVGLASLLPVATAAPQRKRRDTRRSPPSQPLPPPSRLTPTPTTPPVRRDSVPHYLDPYSEPSVLPSVRHLIQEDRLPYVLTQGDDGQWSKVDYGWSIYGRQAGPTNAVLVDAEGQTVQSNVPSATWAVEENLPTGWGQSSSRTDFYKVPLIAVASVILAIGIVTVVIIIAFKRRKAVRRAKRRAERQRRKALAAAGLTENDINENSANAAMAEKLQALEEKHRNGKRRKFGSPAIVRSKVKNWNQSLRRRRGKKTDGDGDQDDGGHMEVVHEDEGADQEGDKPVEPASGPVVLNQADRTSEDSAGSATDPPSDGAGFGSDSHNDSSPTASTVSGHAEGSAATTTAAAAAASGATTTPYFPPAYRPASVRSLHMGPSAGSSSLASSTHDTAPPTVLEKTNAPGYYPAPATVDTEEALAVVSRSQGKSRAIVDDEEEARADRMRHVATDDKRVLEQLRLGASAPSREAAAPDLATDGDHEEAGPSAPHFDVDEQGFERLALEEAGPSAPPEPIATATPVPSSSATGSLPAPPLRIQQRSYLSRSSPVLDEAALLPSAPPVMPIDFAHDSSSSSPSGPSAPPMLDDAAAEELASTHETVSTVPSAPPLELEAEDEHDGAVEHSSMEHSLHDSTASVDRSAVSAPSRISVDVEGNAEEGEDDAETSLQRTERESSRSSAHPGVVFLPRYEP